MTKRKASKNHSARPRARKPEYKLFEDEHPDIIEDLKTVLEDPEPWLDTPNAHFMGSTPRELIGTEREVHLRDWIRRVKHRVPT